MRLSPSQAERDRFRRELQILTGTVRHRAIVELFDWNGDIERPWYISELGSSFTSWWRHQKKQTQHDPAGLVDRAIQVLAELTSALSVCHKSGVVHRDIKPNNLVVKRGVGEPWPVLIDFGIAHDEAGSRLTPLDGAVGNERFSPDVMRSRLSEVPSWLDVFDLAQLLMWMLDQRAPKAHWRRPIHWKYARYRDDIPEDLRHAIRAFTAACANEATAPANGEEVGELLASLFPRPALSQTAEVDLCAIQRAQTRGEVNMLLAEAEVQEEVQSAAPLNASGAGFASFGREAVGTIWNTETAATGTPTISGTPQVGETLTAGTSGIADADGLTKATFTYQWLADDADIAGATGSTYTLVEADEGKIVKMRVSFTDDGGNDETLTSAATDAVAALEPPAKPTGLSATPSHDRVVLTWDDPNDDTITGYVILRRNRETDTQGQFTELAPDTGTAATTYTDDTVAAETPYTYRIKAINEHGTSERSRWVHVETTAAPTPEGTPEQSVSEGDPDLPNDNFTPGRVAVGGSATGAIGTGGDQDRFAVELVAGRTYQLDLTGSPGGGGTLPDTFFRALYNSEGQYQADSYNDDFDGGRDSRVTFTPPESGTYYARVSGDRDEVGSYTLSLTDVTRQ